MDCFNAHTRWIRSLWICCVMLMVAWHPAAAEDSCKLSRSVVDGQELLILENPFIALTLAPARGGACVQFLYKPTGAKWTGPGDDIRILGDHIWNPRNGTEDWSQAPYRVAVLEDTPEEVTVELTGQGKTGMLQFTDFRKRITLTRDSSAVRVRYAFDVRQEAMSAQTVGLWFKNGLWLSGHKMTAYTPTLTGVQTLRYDPATPAPESWEYDPARGWRGCIGDDGSGMAVRMEYKNLMCFYTWQDQAQMSMDWMFRNATIRNNSTYETEVDFLPFHGLPTVSGAGSGAVASLMAPPTVAAGIGGVIRAKVCFAGPSKAARAIWSWRRLPETMWREAGTAPVAASTPGVVDLSYPWRPEGDGIYGLRLQVVEGDKPLVEAETSCAVGAARGEYVMLPESPRIGDPKDRFGRTPVNASEAEIPWRFDVPTPHVEWAKPYIKGKTRALILVHWQNAREVVELAQRMDLDFDCPLVSYYDDGFYIGDAYGKQNPEVTSELIRGYLKKKAYDVIVVSGVNWSGLVDKGLAGLLREQVKQGVGLVYIGPRQLPQTEDWSMLGIDLKKPQVGRNATWQPLKDNPIVSGVPTEVLPATGVIGYAPTNSTVFLTANNGPTVIPMGVARENDGQRTVVFNYAVSRILSGYGDTLTPYLRSLPERFNYWEYHLSLLAKAILWAAKREPTVALTLSVEPTQPATGTPVTVMATLGNAAAQAGPMTLECVLRDRYWKELARQSYDVATAPTRFVIDRYLPAGLYFADSILRAQGKVVNWGSVAFHVSGESTLASFALPGKPAVAGGSHHFVSSDEVAPVAQIRNARPGLKLNAEFSDSFGRVLARRNLPVPASPAGGNVEVKVPFTMDRPLATTGNIHVNLKSGNRTLDQADVDFVTFPDRYVQRTWDDFEWIPMGSIGPYTQGYLVPTAARLYHEAGIGMMFGSAGWDSSDDLRNEHEATIRSGFRLVEFYLWNSYPTGYEEDRKAYAETHDRKYLERKPSLSDPEYRQSMLAEVQRKVRTLKIFHPAVWGWGDEQSVIGRIPVFDYDFSPAALKDFRQWLQEDYKTLDALNAEWKTDFRAWDDVVPSTTSEAQASRNFASWSDHRTFMEESYAGFFDMLQRAVREENPGAITGLSGTQQSTAYNGTDWTRFSSIFGFLQPYYYNGQAEIHPALNPSAIKAPWVTGYGSVSRRGENVWEALLRGDNGVSFFSPASFLNPDYTYTRAALSDMPAVKSIQQTGLGKLLMGGDKLRYDPIAVLHSQRAIHGATAIQREWWYSHRGWFQALYALGFAPRLISYVQLDDGELTVQKYKVCILPMTCAISRRQADNLRKYVESGGVLITDHHTGIFDGHCGTALPGMLDDLFGIRHTAFNAESPGAGNLAFRQDTVANLDLSALSTNTSLPEGGLALRGGHALSQVGGVPCVIVNAVGAGRTCYLNLEIGKHTTGRDIAVSDFHRALASALMTWAGVMPAVRAEPMLVDGRIYAHTDGKARYIGYVRPDAEPQVRTLVIAQARYVYDCQDGTYFGLTNRFSARRSDRAVDLFALLPYRVTGLRVDSRQTARVGERCTVPIVLSANGGTPERHVVHVTVLRPDGTEAGYYSANVVLVGAKGILEIPFALNDPTGAWTLKARDAATGVIAQARLRLGK